MKDQVGDTAFNPVAEVTTKSEGWLPSAVLSAGRTPQSPPPFQQKDEAEAVTGAPTNGHRGDARGGRNVSAHHLPQRVQRGALRHAAEKRGDGSTSALGEANATHTYPDVHCTQRHKSRPKRTKGSEEMRRPDNAQAQANSHSSQNLSSRQCMVRHLVPCTQQKPSMTELSWLPSRYD